MAGTPPLQFSLSGQLPTALAHAGQTLRGVVAELEGALVIRANGASIPIAQNAGLTAGQQVAVRVVAGGPTPQVQVTPLSVTVRADPQLAATLSNGNLSGEIVASGGKLSFVHGKTAIALPANQTLFAAGDRVVLQTVPNSNGTLASLVPASGGTAAATGAAQTLPSIPVPPVVANTGAAQHVQAVFTQAESLGPGIAAIQNAVAQPAVGAALPSNLGAAFAQVFAPLLRPDAADFPAALKRWGQRLGAAPEASLAKAAGSAGAVQESPSAVLQMVRNDPALRRVLAERGELRAFDAMADRVLERLGGGNLQQLRSVDHPYWFLEFPFDPSTGIERALVHFFEDGAGGGGDQESGSATVVLDLSLTQLGDVWMKLAIIGGHCTCQILVTSEDVLELVREFEDDLASALASAGAERVSVVADLWDGDRVGRSGALLGAMDGVDVSA